MSALAREGTVRGPLNDPRLTSQIIDWSLKAADVSAALQFGPALRPRHFIPKPAGIPSALRGRGYRTLHPIAQC